MTLCGPLKKEEKIRRERERMAPPDSHANYRATCSEPLLYVLHISCDPGKEGTEPTNQRNNTGPTLFLPLCLSLRHEKCHFQEILRPTDRPTAETGFYFRASLLEKSQRDISEICSRSYFTLCALCHPFSYFPALQSFFRIQMSWEFSGLGKRGP